MRFKSSQPFNALWYYETNAVIYRKANLKYDSLVFSILYRDVWEYEMSNNLCFMQNNV